MQKQEYMKNPIADYETVVEMIQVMYPEVSGYDFYRDIFPDNEESGEIGSKYLKPNAVYLYQDEADLGSKRRLRRRIMLNDTWEQDYIDFVERNPMTLCSGLSYRGRTNKLEAAQRIHALVFDLDAVGVSQFKNLLLRIGKKPGQVRALPIPTYIVVSGSGLHLYYVFEQPIDLYPNIKLQFKALKYDLTYRLWDYKLTTQRKEIQYQGINQGFRMVGSLNSKYGTVIRAFKVGSKVKLSYINAYAMDKSHMVDIRKPFRPTQLTLLDAKDKYPEWYERRIVKKAGSGHWHCNIALYEWWKRQIEHIIGGHRYFFLMCLAIYACKCDVSKQQLKHDMNQLFELLAEVEHENPFTQDDVKSAMEAYDKAYYCFTIDDIEKLSGVRIERNKRNGRKQAVHLMGARALQQINDQVNGTNWRDGNGRPDKAQQVFEYRAVHPDARKADCIRDTGLSKKTVYKWWNWQPQEKSVDDMTDAEYEDLYWGEENTALMWSITRESHGHWYQEDDDEYEKFVNNRRATVSPEKRIEMRDQGFRVSQEAEYDAMIEALERKIEENYLEWSEKGDAMRGE